MDTIKTKKKSPVKDTLVMRVDKFSTPLGKMFVAADEKKVYLLGFLDTETVDNKLKIVEKYFVLKILFEENPITNQTKKELEEYFQGERKVFTLPLGTLGTPFEKEVWESLLAISYGVTWSYQKQAIHIGRKTAVRAVAGANASNRIAIVIPCHRVIGKNGQLTGYGGGIERKKWLLELEKKYATRMTQ